MPRSARNEKSEPSKAVESKDQAVSPPPAKKPSGYAKLVRARCARNARAGSRSKVTAGASVASANLPRWQPGERVGAILGRNDDGVVEFFGYGVYEGDFTPIESAGAAAEAVKSLSCPNPRIRLDSGKVVYGCECWWGPEQQIKDTVAKAKRVVQVDIDEVRANWRSGDGQ